MKKRIEKNPKITKGMPSAVVLSFAIHVALFFLAGLLVVFTVVKKEEKKFVPPKAVVRPKMKLRKPKVKKTSKPKPTTRIVTKVKRGSMPDIQLPEMSGMSDGLAGGVGGFDLMPDLGDVTLFGSGQSIGSDFEGVYYDSKLDRQGRTIVKDTWGDPWRAVLHKFLQRDWDPSVFSRYYRSPNKLYATNFVVPLTLSSVAPDSFGDENSIGALWMAHYKGQLVHKEGITFRFWGIDDEFMAVRVDGKLVLALDWVTPNWDLLAGKIVGNLWKSTSADSRKYYMGNNHAELARLPDFNIDFINLLRQVRYEGRFYDIENWGRPPEKIGSFGVRLKQTSTGEYNHELQVELFVIGQERSRGRFIFLDHQKNRLLPRAKRPSAPTSSTARERWCPPMSRLRVMSGVKNTTATWSWSRMPGGRSSC
ncbi:MAG: hypothetical protein DRP64_05545 [Verrucomicrobia bacterium]|nr:MAG: hypothetical protein DRP64_05545 [Verrucomicrobiota bacterium]